MKRNKFLGFNGVYGCVGEEKRREEEEKRDRKYLRGRKIRGGQRIKLLEQAIAV